MKERKPQKDFCTPRYKYEDACVQRIFSERFGNESFYYFNFRKKNYLIHIQDNRTDIVEFNKDFDHRVVCSTMRHPSSKLVSSTNDALCNAVQKNEIFPLLSTHDEMDFADPIYDGKFKKPDLQSTSNHVWSYLRYDDIDINNDGYKDEFVIEFNGSLRSGEGSRTFHVLDRARHLADSLLPPKSDALMTDAGYLNPNSSVLPFMYKNSYYLLNKRSDYDKTVVEVSGKQAKIVCRFSQHNDSTSQSFEVNDVWLTTRGTEYDHYRIKNKKK